MLALLVTLALTAPDAGAFADSPLGQKRAGENVSALDERWVEGLADGPLLSRVERRGDDVAIALYAAIAAQPDASGPAYEEKARFPVAMARQLVSAEVRQLGGQSVLAVIATADDPDEHPEVVVLVGRGPKQLLEASFLRDAPESTPTLELGPTEGFTFASDGGSELDGASSPQRVKLEFADGGAAQVSLGQRQRVWRWKSGAFSQVSDAYRDFLSPLKLDAPGHRKLVDGKPTTSEKLAVGSSVSAKLPASAKLRLLRLIPGCLESEARAAKEPSATKFQVQIDQAPPMDVELGKPVLDARVFGAGEFTLGKGYGTGELLVFDPPLAVSALSVKVLAATGGAGQGCVAEIAAY